MKAHLQSSLRALTGHNTLELSDKDVENFQKVVKGITFETGTFEMAVVFVAIAVYDKADFIVLRNSRDIDFPLIAEAFIHAYRHRNDAPISELVWEKLKGSELFAEEVILSQEFMVMLGYIPPKVETKIKLRPTLFSSFGHQESQRIFQFESTKDLGTKLHNGHTRQERIDELQEVSKKKYEHEPDTQQYINEKINYLNTITEEDYGILRLSIYDIVNRKKIS